MQESLSIELPLQAQSAGWAREALAEFRNRLDGDAFIDLRLIVSELVADAVRSGEEGSEPIVLRIELRDRDIHAAVHEGEAALRPPSPLPVLGERGWGVHLARILGDQWGSRYEGSRGCVWVQKPLAGTA